MTTQLEIALARSETLEIIPRISDERGRYWRQPKRSLIEVDAIHALMSKSVFDELLEYSSSQPTGVYEGKMWKGKKSDGSWYLAWFGPCNDPNFVSNNYRDIIIL